MLRAHSISSLSTMRRIVVGLMASGLICLASTAHADGWGDRLRQMAEQLNQNSTSQTTNAQSLPQSEVVAGLKSALADGASTAVTQLGQNDGFWGNAERRIPLPGWMNSASGLLKQAGYADQMNNLQLSMNRAAEQATAEAGPIVKEAINAMTVQDAYQILRGSNTAATDYLRTHTSDQLAAKFEPIIAKTTAQSRAANSYDALTAQAKPMLQMVPGLNLDLNDYVTQQALNGLFSVIGQQETQIRQNPAARSTDLLKQVFGAASR